MTRRISLLTFLVLALSVVLPRVAVAQKLSEAEFKRLVEHAVTAADHQKLAAYYRAHAAEHEADAKLHEKLAASNPKGASEGHAWELSHASEHYAAHSREAAEALRELAALHEGMAEVADAKPANSTH